MLQLNLGELMSHQPVNTWGLDTQFSVSNSTRSHILPFYSINYFLVSHLQLSVQHDNNLPDPCSVTGSCSLDT